MTLIDHLIVIFYLLATLLIAFSLRKRARKNLEEFFLSARNLPWWLAGISMVATTFSIDTPLAVSELVVVHGISGNWLWWNMLAGGMLTTFFFARLWHRTGILTDLEFIELRYSGKAASFLRGLRALYFGFLLNGIIIGWLSYAFASFLKIVIGLPPEYVHWCVFFVLFLVAIYVGFSGLSGVVFTDLLQFVLAMVGSVVLAIVLLQLPEIGGIQGLKSKLPQQALEFFPQIGSAKEDPSGVYLNFLPLGLAAFLACFVVQWWASWYPGNEPGGGGYIAQRMMSTRSEKEASYATLLFQVTHYCIRSWPWILVALATTVLYPYDLEGENAKYGYFLAARDFLPVGLRGLFAASMVAAFMSTVSTQLNWGSSYLVNDFYARFLRRRADQKELILVSRLVMLPLVIFGFVIALNIQSISDIWKLVLEGSAGIGLVLILRWYWTRINAYSEITATISPVIAYLFCKWYLQELDPAWGKDMLQDPRSFFFITGFTTFAWLMATFLTKSENKATIQRFQQRVWPGEVKRGFYDIAGKLLGWLCAIILCYSALFFTGSLIFMNVVDTVMYGGILLLSLFLFQYLSRKFHLFD